MSPGDPRPSAADVDLVVGGAGFLGRGFTTTPLVGSVLVDLAEGGDAPARFRRPGRP